MDRAKKTRASKNLSDVRRNLLECMWHFSQKGSPRPTLRKQYHMCRLIYKVLTPGPERISILLGKCFPLGLVSATAYRCSRHAVKAGLFPLNEKKIHFAFSSGQTRRDGATTSARVHSAERCLQHLATGSSDREMFAGGPPATDAQAGTTPHRTTPHRTGLSALNALDLCW